MNGETLQKFYDWVEENHEEVIEEFKRYANLTTLEALTVADVKRYAEENYPSPNSPVSRIKAIQILTGCSLVEAHYWHKANKF